MQFNRQQYYLNHQKLSFVGNTGQAVLQQAKILVIGIGGLGCPCLQSIAGCGIGTIGIADFDTISISNLHRQALFNYNDVGKLKTIVAAEKLVAMNPSLQIISHNLFVDENNVLELISNYDVVVDCTDNFCVRYLINDACVFKNKPLVYGAIHQTEGHLTVFNVNNSPTLRCLFPNEENHSIESCDTIGSYSITTSIIGTMMANEIIKIILRHPSVLAGILCQFDSITESIKKIKYTSSTKGRKKSLDRFNQPLQINSISPLNLSEKIKKNNPVFLIDVRELNEHQNFNIGGSHISLKLLLQQDNFPYATTDEIIVYCQAGIRSMQAAKHFISKGFINVNVLQGGINLWQQQFTE